MAAREECGRSAVSGEGTSSRDSGNRVAALGKSSSSASTAGGSWLPAQGSLGVSEFTVANTSVLTSATLGFDSAGHSVEEAGGSLARRELDYFVGGIDGELACIRPELAACLTLREEAEMLLKVAMKKEKEEWINLRHLRQDQWERRRKLTIRIQGCVRSWLLRRRIMVAFNQQLSHEVGLSEALPDQLRENLQSLQHCVYDLKHSPTTRNQAATKIQSWWRKILAGRTVRVLRLAKEMTSVRRMLYKMAVRIQSTYRMHKFRLAFYGQIRRRMSLSRIQQLREMEAGLRVIIKLQRQFRLRLSRRLADDLREELEDDSDESDCGAVTNNTMTVDSWGRKSIRNAPPVETPRAALAVAPSKPPMRDHELVQLDGARVVPFYGSATHRPLQHKIGGAGQAYQESPPAGSAITKANLPDLPLRSWEVYPKGLSHGFVERLDKDAWPQTIRQNNKRLQRVRARRVPVARPLKTTTCLPPPLHSALRAREREGSTQASAAVEIDGDALHPLLSMGGLQLPQLVSLTGGPGDRLALAEGGARNQPRSLDSARRRLRR